MPGFQVPIPLPEPEEGCTYHQYVSYLLSVGATTLERMTARQQSRYRFLNEQYMGLSQRPVRRQVDFRPTIHKDEPDQ